MGTVAVSVVSRGVAGSQRTTVADVTYSSSYATGGDTIPVASLGLSQVEEAHVISGKLDATRTNAGYTANAHGTQSAVVGTRSAPLLKVYNGSTSEVTAATNLSTLPSVRIEFRGH